MPDPKSNPPQQSQTNNLPSLLFWAGLMIITVLAVILRVWKLGEPSLWTDENFTEFRAQAPLGDALHSMWNAGNQHPLYYFLLRILPTDTELKLRLPGAILGIIGVPLMGWSAWKLLDSHRLGFWAAALLAISPFHIMLSRNARAYSMLLLFSLLTLYLFLCLLQGHRSRWMWLAFIISSMAAYLTHLAGVALGISQLVLLWWLWRDQHKFLKQWLVAQIIAGLPLVIWLIATMLNLESTYPSSFPSPGVHEVLVTLWNLLTGYDGTFTWAMIPGIVAGSALLVIGWRSALRQRRDDTTGLYSLLLIWVAILPVLILSMTVSPSYQDRYFTPILPAILLSILIGSIQLGQRWGNLLLAVVFLSAGLNTAQMFRDTTYQRADWRGVNTLILANYQPGDGFLLERDHPLMAFQRYYSGESEWLEHLVLLRDEPDTSDLEAETNRIWVLYRNPLEDFHRQGAMPEFDPFDPELNIIGAWLAERQERVISVTVFRGVTVVLVAN